MKHIQIASLIAILCAFAPLRLAAAEAALPAKLAAGEEQLFAAGHFTLAPFASYRAHEVERLDGRFGVGLAAGYFLADNIQLELETLGERYTERALIDSLAEAGANFKGYLPFGDTGFAAYGLIGYTRNLQFDENRMNMGAGLEWDGRSKSLFGAVTPYAFADGRWTFNPVDKVGHALFRVGTGFKF